MKKTIVELSPRARRGGEEKKKWNGGRKREAKLTVNVRRTTERQTSKEMDRAVSPQLRINQIINLWVAQAYGTLTIQSTACRRSGQM